MLDLGRYLLGVADIVALAAFAWLGASQLRSRLLPDFSGAPAHLATAVLALALLIWIAELLGSFGLFQPAPYLLAVAIVGTGIAVAARRTLGSSSSPVGGAGVKGSAGPLEGPGGGGTSCTFSAIPPRSADHAPPKKLSGAPTRSLSPTPGPPGRSASPSWATLLALLIAAAAVIHFAAGARLRLGTGMTGFDSTWYHGPFAAGFFQGGDTWDLHYIAPQFLAWLYPANAEIFHATGMLAFHRDLLSPLLNLGWFAGCLFSLWCIGRPFGVAPWSLALGAIALSVPALADQAGEARNDIVGIFFLLAAVAIALNVRQARSIAEHRRVREEEGQGAGDAAERAGDARPHALDARELARAADHASRSPATPSVSEIAGRSRHPEGGPSCGLPTGALIVAGLAAGLAAGTKLNFLLPAAVLVVGLAVVAPQATRWRALATAGFGALAGGGYWYLRNLAHSGNPLPWFDHLGPISLPAPEQALGGREGHTVLSYLTDGSVWSDWFLPGLHGGLTVLWPLIVGLALLGLALSLGMSRPSGHGPGLGRRASRRPTADSTAATKTPATATEAERLLRVIGLVGLAAALAWLIAPTSASGPQGLPRGFESGLRYLAPALVLGLALLPTVPALRERLRGLSPRTAAGEGGVGPRTGGPSEADVAEAQASSPSAQVPPLRRRGSGGTIDALLWFGRDRWLRGRRVFVLIGLSCLTAVAIGYPVQRHYLRNRYANPEFTSKGLDAAFKWARSISGARIATTGTRQYPLFGTDLSNHVQFVGIPRPHGGFVTPSACPAWRRAVNAGHYDYLVATLDRLEPGKPAYPPQATWTAGPSTHVVLRSPGTVVFQLTARLAPSACP
jgi:hypothetical protein